MVRCTRRIILLVGLARCCCVTNEWSKVRTSCKGTFVLSTLMTKATLVCIHKRMTAMTRGQRSWMVGGLWKCDEVRVTLPAVCWCDEWVSIRAGPLPLLVISVNATIVGRGKTRKLGGSQWREDWFSTNSTVEFCNFWFGS